MVSGFGGVRAELCAVVDRGHRSRVVAAALEPLLSYCSESLPVAELTWTNLTSPPPRASACRNRLIDRRRTNERRAQELRGGREAWKLKGIRGWRKLLLRCTRHPPQVCSPRDLTTYLTHGRRPPSRRQSAYGSQQTTLLRTPWLLRALDVRE